MNINQVIPKTKNLHQELWSAYGEGGGGRAGAWLSQDCQKGWSKDDWAESWPGNIYADTEERTASSTGKYK